MRSAKAVYGRRRLSNRYKQIRARTGERCFELLASDRVAIGKRKPDPGAGVVARHEERPFAAIRCLREGVREPAKLRQRGIVGDRSLAPDHSPQMLLSNAICAEF